MYLANAARDLLVIGMGADYQYSRNSLPLSLRYSYPQRKQEKKASGSNDAKIKENRQKEVQDALDNYQKLLKSYIEDYGKISIKNDSDLFSIFGNKSLPWWF